jgi:hypothetical protein
VNDPPVQIFLSNSPNLSQILVTTITGIICFVIGTGLSYRLFIHRHVRNLEIYKERVKVYKRIDRLITRIVSSTERVMINPSRVGEFSSTLEAFNSYVKGSNRLFMPSTIHRYFFDIIQAQEQVIPSEFSSPTEPQKLSDESLRHLLNVMASIQDSLQKEIQGRPLPIPISLLGCLKRIHGALSEFIERREKPGHQG